MIKNIDNNAIFTMIVFKLIVIFNLLINVNDSINLFNDVIIYYKNYSFIIARHA